MARPSSRRPAAAFAAALFLWAASAVADIKIPPAPSRWATDAAGYLSPGTVRELDGELERFEAATGRQVLVYVGTTTGGYPIEEFAQKAFAAWRVGRKGLDDGLVLFIMAEDRKLRIEVGYGLEDRMPDALAGRIINDVLVPKIQAGDPDGAVRDAVASITRTLTSGDEPPPSQARASRFGESRTKVPPIFLIIGGIIFFLIFLTNPSLALWLLFNILTGGRGGGGGGGGGGGFRGGGGRSGGGGASGSW